MCRGQIIASKRPQEKMVRDMGLETTLKAGSGNRNLSKEQVKVAFQLKPF